MNLESLKVKRLELLCGEDPSCPVAWFILEGKVLNFFIAYIVEMLKFCYIQGVLAMYFKQLHCAIFPF